MKSMGHLDFGRFEHSREGNLQNTDWLIQPEALRSMAASSRSFFDRGTQTLSTSLLHDLLDRESATSPDEARGRESVLTYEAVVSAV